MAAINGNSSAEAIMTLLLQYGADQSLCNKKGKSALDYARAKGNKRRTALLDGTNPVVRKCQDVYKQ